MSSSRVLSLVTVAALVAATLYAAAAGLPASPGAAPTEAYLAASTAGLRVYDVSDTTAPKEVGAAAALTGTKAVVVQGTLAFTAEGEEGLRVLDVGDPARPKVVGSWPGTTDGLDVAGQVAFVAGPTGLSVLDISDPQAPARVGFDRGGATGVAVRDALAFVVSPLGLRVVDVSDSTQPEPIGTLPGRADDIALAGGLAYLVDTVTGLRVVDISDPAKPQVVGATTLPAPAHALVVGPAYGYAAAGGRGLFVLDVRDAQVPRFTQLVQVPADDVALADDLLFVAAGPAGLRIFNVKDPAAPQPVGGAPSLGPALGIALPRPAPAEATPTDAPTRTPTLAPTDTPTLTPTPLGASPTPGPGDTATPTPAATEPPSPEPSRRPSITPAATRDPSRRWLTFGPGSAVPAGAVRFVATGPDGRIWLRVADPAGGPDRVVAARSKGAWLRFAGLREAVEANAALIGRQGALEDLWAVDTLGRIWIGPSYFDGRSWHLVATDDRQTGGSLRHQWRALADRFGQVWVPFEASLDCPRPDACNADGLRAFDPSGKLVTDIQFDPVPEAGFYGVQDVHLVPGTGQTPPLAGASAARAAPAQSGRVAFAATRHALYRLPENVPVAYPGLEDLFRQPSARNAGYATAAALNSSAQLVVFTWLERHVGRTLTHQILANTWTGAAWQTVDLTASPLFPDGAEFERIVAAAFAPDGALWVGTAAGKVGLYKDGAWQDVFSAADSPLPAGTGINDLTVGADGSVWVATETGLVAYGDIDRPVVEATIYLPYTERATP